MQLRFATMKPFLCSWQSNCLMMWQAEFVRMWPTARQVSGLPALGKHVSYQGPHVSADGALKIVGHFGRSPWLA